MYWSMNNCCDWRDLWTNTIFLSSHSNDSILFYCAKLDVNFLLRNCENSQIQKDWDNEIYNQKRYGSSQRKQTYKRRKKRRKSISLIARGGIRFNKWTRSVFNELITWFTRHLPMSYYNSDYLTLFYSNVCLQQFIHSLLLRISLLREQLYTSFANLLSFEKRVVVK